MPIQIPDFDLDGTLIESAQMLFKAFAEKGFYVDPESMRNAYKLTFNGGKSLPKDFLYDVFFYRAFTERWHTLTHVDPYVQKFINDLYFAADEKPIRIITSRPNGLFMHSTIENCLAKLFPDIDFIISVVGGSADKFRYMQSEIMFEDRRKTAISLASRGKIVFMRRYHYNDLKGHRVAWANIDDDCNIAGVKWFLEKKKDHGAIIVFDDYSQINMDWIQGLLITGN